MPKGSLLLALLATLVATVPAQGGAGGGLHAYVAREDASYDWTLRHEGRLGETRYVELHLTSQTWREIPWQHQLYVIRPSTMAADVRHGLLFISSGRWHPGLEAGTYRPQLPPQAQLFATVAELLGTPVAVLRQVPFQPLFDGRTEDRLIAYSFERHLETGEDDWPLLLPMVKSAVRAMDAVQAFVAESWGVELETFTVTGASKRGWTTWLAAAVDPRVTAFAPMVIDMLNLEAHLALQQESWGGFSAQIGDYTARGLHERVASEAGQRLLDMVDPYRHRSRLAQPKLIVIATNDPYWPLDASKLYLDELEGPTRLLLLPNSGHRTNDYGRLIGSLNALHQHAARGLALPEPRWRFEERDGRLRLTVEADTPPRRVLGWRATAPGRDFRDAEWSARPCQAEGDAYVCELELPEDGHGALFAELVFVGEAALPVHLSTAVRIAGRTPAG